MRSSLAWAALLAACSSQSQQVAIPDGAGADLAMVLVVDDLAITVDQAVAPDADVRTPLGANRDRLLATYLEYLRSTPTTTQSNGLSGGSLGSVCELWERLDPSGRDVFFTLTARMQGSRLGDDGSFMLDHIVKIYRISGGQNATATDPGSCGGAEYNRMIMSMDLHLQQSLLLANTRQGQKQPSGVYDLADITSFWRDSHDGAGPHAPFDVSDETEAGAPRGQVQYFRDPSSALATSALGRLDLTTLVDPLALEMDQDYDCVHNSNPDCSYTFYGPACIPQTSMLGLDIYVANYGSIDGSWRPSGCP